VLKREEGKEVRKRDAAQSSELRSDLLCRMSKRRAENEQLGRQREEKKRRKGGKKIGRGTAPSEVERKDLGERLHHHAVGTKGGSGCDRVSLFLRLQKRRREVLGGREWSVPLNSKKGTPGEGNLVGEV